MASNEKEMMMKSFLDGFDLLVARLRGPFRALTGLGVAFQGAIASGQLKIPDKFAHWIAFASIIVAYFTMRGPKESVALAGAQKIERAPSASIQAQMDAAGAIPSSEMITPNDRPKR